MTAPRWKCDECGGIIGAEQQLQAPDPFDPTLLVFGCPSCRMCVQFELVCDEPQCSEIVTCGWPSTAGYRQTCSTHAEWQARQKEKP